METVTLVNKSTGKVGDYNIYLSNTPQTIMVEIKGGEARGFDTFEALAKEYEFYNKGEKNNG